LTSRDGARQAAEKGGYGSAGGVTCTIGTHAARGHPPSPYSLGLPPLMPITLHSGEFVRIRDGPINRFGNRRPWSLSSRVRGVAKRRVRRRATPTRGLFHRDAELTRFADDFVAAFPNHEDARRFRQEVEERLAAFGLRVDSTRDAGVGSSHRRMLRPICSGKPGAGNLHTGFRPGGDGVTCRSYRTHRGSRNRSHKRIQLQLLLGPSVDVSWMLGREHADSRRVTASVAHISVAAILTGRRRIDVMVMKRNGPGDGVRRSYRRDLGAPATMLRHNAGSHVAHGV
jgi:hypothetical protein